jgi:hypothetical protein
MISWSNHHRIYKWDGEYAYWRSYSNVNTWGESLYNLEELIKDGKEISEDEVMLELL